MEIILHYPEKVVLDTKNKCHVPQPSKASAAVLKHALVAELKMALDPANVSIRFNNGPWYHLFVKEFTLAEAPPSASNLDAEHSPGPACMPEGADDAQEDELSEHESEFEEVHPELAAACVAFMHGPCHEDAV